MLIRLIRLRSPRLVRSHAGEVPQPRSSPRRCNLRPRRQRYSHFTRKERGKAAAKPILACPWVYDLTWCRGADEERQRTPKESLPTSERVAVRLNDISTPFFEDDINDIVRPSSRFCHLTPTEGPRESSDTHPWAPSFFPRFTPSEI